MSVRVAINGFGRVGRAAFRSAYEREADIEWAGINDLVDPATLAHLLRRDTVYGRFAAESRRPSRSIVVDGLDIPVFAEQDPAALPGTSSTWTSSSSRPAGSARVRTPPGTSRQARRR